MGIKEDVGNLLDTEYCSLNEKEIVTKFCNSLNDLNHTTLDANYFAYYFYQRNFVNHNETSFNIVQRIYRELKSKQL